jgi:hypothetical protein
MKQHDKDGTGLVNLTSSLWSVFGDAEMESPDEQKTVKNKIKMTTIEERIPRQNYPQKSGRRDGFHFLHRLVRCGDFEALSLES